MPHLALVPPPPVPMGFPPLVTVDPWISPAAAQLTITPETPRVRVIGAAALRKRREREHSEDVRVLPVLAHTNDLAEALLLAGRLTETEALEPARVAEEASKVLAEWVHIWLASAQKPGRQNVTRDIPGWWLPAMFHG
jgi:hypothetical protein